jgi:hypothetical protein
VGGLLIRAAAVLALAFAFGAAPASAATLTELAGVQGQILDASPAKVLYWQDHDSHGPLKIRDVATGTDVTVPVPAGREVGTGFAALIDGGAMYTSFLEGGDVLSAHMEEWRNGVLTDLGFVNSTNSLMVAGNYAIWNTDPNNGPGGHELIRRELTTGTNVTVATDAINNGSVVLASGDVYYMQASLARIYKWHAGVSTQVTHGSAGETSTFPLTTGSNVAFLRTNQQQATSVFFSDGTSDSLLPGSGNPAGMTNPGRDYAVAGDWIAYTRANQTEVWTRGPAGSLAKVSTGGAAAIFASILGIIPTGQVMYDRETAGGEGTFLGVPGAHPFPVGGSEPKAFWSAGHWYIVRSSSLLRLEIGTAITTRPPPATQAHTADFALASTEPNPTFTCTLDDAAEPCDDDNHLTGLAEGPHTFVARTTAPATDHTGDTANWIVDTTPPDSFSLSTPAAAAALSNQTPELSWQAANDSGGGIASYEVAIDDQPAVSTGSATTTFTASSALADGPHSWQVRAIDAAGNTRDSETRSFTVDTEPPSAPDPGNPTDDEAVPAARPTFNWSPASDDGSGIAGYDVEIDGASARVGSEATSFTPSADLGDGEHNWRIVAVDAAGNSHGLPMIRFRVDTRPPVAVIAANPNPVLAGQSVHFDATSSTPAAAALTHFEWDLDGNASFETDTGSLAGADMSYETTGDRDVQVRVTDSAGRSATAFVPLSVTPAPLPGPPGVSINDAALVTRDAHVTLTLRWPHFATQMLVSNDGGFAGARPRPVSPELPWRLASTGPERLPKTVYVRFIGGLAGNEPYQDDIVLDETPPRIELATVKRRARGRYAIGVHASDRTSGLSAIQVATGHGATGPLLPYARRFVVASRRSPAKVRVIDRAGNRSKWTRLSIRR